MGGWIEKVPGIEGPLFVADLPVCVGPAPQPGIDPCEPELA